MRVLHLSCVAPPYHGGIGRVAVEEVTHLRTQGVDAVVVSAIGGGNAELIKRMPVRVSAGNAAFPKRRAFERMLVTADLVHLHYPFYGTAGFVAKLRRQGKIKRLVLTLHMNAEASGFKGLIFDLHRTFFQANILNSADALVVSSRDYATHSAFASWADRVIELPFGVDEMRFAPGPKERASFGIPEDVRVVSFLGGMDAPHAFKGVDVLLRALSELPQNVWCVLVGGGSLLHSYKALATKLGVEARVRFLGHLKDHQLPAFYRMGDVHVVPSISGAEAFSLVAVEAQACGIPVVASDLPGVRTVVADKVTGLLTPPGDARELAAHLRLMLENPGMRQEFGLAARARVLERFTWTRHVDGLMEIYKNVCASRS